jgi:hypothetical protein
MFKNLFSKSTQSKKKKANVIYKEYLPLLKDKLIPLGFDIEEGSGLGNFSTFKREILKVILVFELREQATHIELFSGRKVKFTTALEQLPENIRKKTSNIEEVKDHLVDKSDISLTLVGTDEEKDSLMKNIDNWLKENL